MIIGNGDIASVLTDKDGWIYFASGVSNSRETSRVEFQKEIDLLEAQPRDQHIVYFSSIAALYSDGPYFDHKRNMEERVRKFPSYAIVRIGNIDWGTNPNTIINYFRNQVARGEELEIQDTFRYVVSKEEFIYWMSLIPDWNCEMHISGERMTVQQIVNKYVYGR